MITVVLTLKHSSHGPILVAFLRHCSGDKVTESKYGTDLPRLILQLSPEYAS